MPAPRTISTLPVDPVDDDPYPCPQKLQGWLTMAEAVEAGGIKKNRLKNLALAKNIFGYQNKSFTRGKSLGEWFFLGPTIHEYHLHSAGVLQTRTLLIDAFRRAGL